MVTENRPSGWYKDPSGQPDMLRWWNGTSWTDDYRPQSEFIQSSSQSSGQSSNPSSSPLAEAPPAGPQPGYSVHDEPLSFAVREQAAAQPTMAAPPSVPPADQPWPGSDRPIPPVTPVQFQAVEPNRTRKRVIMGVVAVVVAAVTGIGGYLVGTSGDDGDKTKPTADGSSAAPSSAAPAPADVTNPNGFSGTPLVGGKELPGGQQIVGPNQKMTFSIPSGWTPQVDPKATSEEARYVLSPYACSGRTGDACARATVVHNLRLLSGGWSELRTLTVGMGQELVAVQTNGSKPPGSLNPIKQQDLKIQGLDGYLALWDVPMLAGQTAPSSYCGVLSVKTAADTTEIAVLQICVDRTGEAPPVSLMDQIANTIKIKT